MALALVDVFEAPDIAAGLKRNSIQVIEQNLVPLGVGDIYWMGHGGTRFSLERKTVFELPTVIGRRLDTQLRKHTANADDVGLIIEGIATPTTNGETWLWEKSHDDKTFYRKRLSKFRYHAMMSYLWRLEKEGINVFFFPDKASLCLGVAGFITNSLKAEHSTLKGYGKTKKIDWEPNPQVASLMGIFSNHGKVPIGEVTAKRIIEKYGTVWNFFNADVGDVGDVISPEMFIKAMIAIGKKVI